MAREAKTYYVFPSTVDVSTSFSVLGAGSFVEELKNTEAHPTGSTPNTAKGAKAGTLNAKLEGKFNMPTLAAGESVIGCKLFIYSKQSKSSETEFIVELGLVTGSRHTATSGTASAWNEASSAT